MQNLAETLGQLLPHGWEAPREDADAESASQGGGTAADRRGSEDAVIALIAAEAGRAEDFVGPGDTLDEDLELTGLALWSVIAQVERELSVTFPDREVEAWRTVEDVLRAAAEATGVR